MSRAASMSRVSRPMHGFLLRVDPLFQDHGDDAQLRFAGAMFWLMWKRLSGS